MHTILPTSTWLAIVPPLIISLRRAVIKPIKFVISFPIQPNPSIAEEATSTPQQLGQKLVFILWFNHSKVCSKCLAKSSWVVPCWGRWTYVIARLSVYHEPWWASICSEVRQQRKLVLDTRNCFCHLPLTFFLASDLCVWAWSVQQNVCQKRLFKGSFNFRLEYAVARMDMLSW